MTIEEFVIQLCSHCGIDASVVDVQIEETDEDISVQLNLPEEESGLFIGYHGETLDAIQRILRLAFQREESDKRIHFNINEYRQQREQKLIDMAFSLADRVIETSQAYTFSYFLPAHERYVIHAALSEDEEYSAVESVSVGQGRSRRLCIQLVGEGVPDGPSDSDDSQEAEQPKE